MKSIHKGPWTQFIMVGIALWLGQASLLQAGLLHRYTFDETSGTTVFDLASGADGTLEAGAAFNGTGQTTLDGTSGYVNLPNGIVSSLTDATFEAWLTWNGVGNWARVFDFGNSTAGEGNQGTGAGYVFLTPRSSGGVAYFGIRRPDQTFDNAVITTGALATNEEVHVAVTYNMTDGVAKLYVNGQSAGYASISQPLSSINDVNNWLGRSQFAGDAYLGGTLNEFRIYDSAQSAAEIRASFNEGPDVDFSDPGALVAVDLQVASALYAWQSAQAMVTADYTGVTDVDVTVGEGVVYSSSDMGVISVNSLGMLQAVGPGMADVTATLNGQSDTVTVTVAAGPALVEAGTLHVDLRPSGLSASSAIWTNFGALTTSNFTRVGSPSLTSVAGIPIPAVSFSGSGDAFVGPRTVADIHGGSDRSMEVWTYNPALAAEETLLAWSHRGGPVGANMSMNYGSNTGVNGYGAVGHWGGAYDLGWVTPPPAGQWHHIVYVYDGATDVRVYVDGTLAVQKTIPGPLITWGNEPIMLGAQRSATNQPPNGQWLSGYINSVRVHGGALSAADVANNYAAGPYKLAVQIQATAASAVENTAATVGGNLLSITAPTDVTIFYGTSDGGMDVSGWEASADLGQIPWGTFSTELTGLDPSTVHYYRTYGSNENGVAWSALMTFKTTGPADVQNLPPKTVTPAYARLVGSVTDTNGFATDVRIYWGPTDGGTDIGSWANVVDLGAQGVGQVEAKVSGLAPNTTYYYAVYANNPGGTSWATPSMSFTTPAVFNPLGYAYELEQTFAGYTNAETLVNFPALVVLSASIPGFNYDQFLSPDAADLRFVEASGAELNYEIENWNPDGNSHVWVQVPELNPSTMITLYWGQAGLSVPAYRTNGATWSEGYAAVWHMTNEFVKDSTAHGYDAISVNNPAAVSDATGIIDGAQDYNAAVGNAYTPVGVLNFTNMTLSTWVWLRDADRQGVFMVKDPAPGGTIGALGNLYFWQQGANLRFETYPWGGDVTIPVANTGGVGTWIYLVATVNGTSQALYTNGVLGGSWTKSSLVGQNNNLFQLAGSMNQSGRFHNGLLDESRASYVPRSPAWIWASYANQSTPGAFGTFGDVVSRPLPLAFSAPAVTNIDSVSADFGVTVISDGGNGISSWGSAYDVTAAPTANLETQTGAETAPLEIVRNISGLTPGGHYYARAFASNAVEGIVYSPDAEFYTEPLAATDVMITEVTNRGFTVSWTPGAGSAGSLVVVSEANPVSAIPQDGATYAADAQYGLGTDLGGDNYAVYAGSGNSVSVSDLSKNTTYYVAVYGYAGSGSLINYQQASPATGSQMTANASVIEVAGEVLIDLNVSRGLETTSGGGVTTWVNYGSVGGSFNVPGNSDPLPTYGLVDGVPGVSFTGNEQMLASFMAPDQITGNDARFSVEYWVFKPELQNESWLLAWSRRGGPAGTFAGVGYGTNASFGAVAHWGSPDLAFGEGVSVPGLASTPVSGVWHHIVVTYDGAMERIYVDGVLNAQEGKSLSIFENDPVALGRPYEASYAPSGTGISYSGAVAAVRVHSEALTVGQIGDNYALSQSFATPVAIIGQPVDRRVGEFASPTFSVTASGTPPVSYQWYTNGTAVDGATASSFTLNNVMLSDSGLQLQAVVSNNIAGTPYTEASDMVTLTVVSAEDAIIHRYSFMGNANDRVGDADGTLLGTASISDGQVHLDGTTGTYVELPGGLIAGLDSLSVEFWASFGINGNWARVFDFGDQNAGGLGRDYLFFSPHSGAGDHRMSIADGDPGYTHEQVVTGPGILDLVTNVHVLAVWDPPAGVMRFYTNGVLESSGGITIPLENVNNVFSWIGRALYNGDAMLNGSIDEFRIYSVALSDAQALMSFNDGPDSSIGVEPMLSIMRVDGSVVLSWPASATGYSLESATSVDPGAVWTDVAEPVVPQGDRNTVTLPITGTMQVFRLMK